MSEQDREAEVASLVAKESEIKFENESTDLKFEPEESKLQKIP